MSEEPTLDPRPPASRKRRGAGIYVAYSIAAALLLGAGALSLGHLTPRRPAAPPAAGTAKQAPSAAKPAPAIATSGQTPGPPPPQAPAPSVTVQMPSVTVKMPDPKDSPAPAAPPVAAAADAKAPDTKPPTEPPPTAAAPPPSPGQSPPAAASPAPPLLGSSPGFVAPPMPPTIAGTDSATGPVNLIAANGLPLPPPEKPPVPGRRVGLCPPGSDLADLAEASPLGSLPRVAPNGCMAWLAYASDFNHLDREHPRLGIAVIGVGMSEPLTQKAVETLPPGTTLVFVPDTPNLDRWIQRARERGLEALLLVPTRSNVQGVPDRGMAPVQMGVAPAENIRRLRAVLATATGYVGVALLPGPVLDDAATLRPLLTEIRDRGLLVLEFERWNGKSLVHPMSRELGVPYSTDIDRPIAWIDRFRTNGQETTARDVDTSLGEVEKFVGTARFGLAWSLARPVAIERIAAWVPGMRTRGIVLAPVTGVTECAEKCQKRLPRLPQPAAAPPKR
ncbi:MAG: divergent polysaccharide deacetylase family protein [Reyranellaceae bacterium]